MKEPIPLSKESNEYQLACWLIHGVRVVCNYDTGRDELEYHNTSQEVEYGFVKFIV